MDTKTENALALLQRAMAHGLFQFRMGLLAGGSPVAATFIQTIELAKARVVMAYLDWEKNQGI